VHAKVVADRADDHEPRIQPLAELERHPAVYAKVFLTAFQSRSDSQGSVDCTRRMILMSQGSAEESHDAVTQELVHGALIAMNLGEQQLEDPRHETMDHLRIELLGQRCETRHVDEQDGDLLPLSFEGALGSKDPLGEVLGSVRSRRTEAWLTGSRSRFSDR